MERSMNRRVIKEWLATAPATYAGKSLEGQPCKRGQSAARTGCEPKSKRKFGGGGELQGPITPAQARGHKAAQTRKANAEKDKARVADQKAKASKMLAEVRAGKTQEAEDGAEQKRVADQDSAGVFASVHPNAGKQPPDVDGLVRDVVTTMTQITGATTPNIIATVRQSYPDVPEAKIRRALADLARTGDANGRGMDEAGVPSYIDEMRRPGRIVNPPPLTDEDQQAAARLGEMASRMIQESGAAVAIPNLAKAAGATTPESRAQFDRLLALGDHGLTLGGPGGASEVGGTYTGGGRYQYWVARGGEVPDKAERGKQQELIGSINKFSSLRKNKRATKSQWAELATSIGVDGSGTKQQIAARTEEAIRKIIRRNRSSYAAWLTHPHTYSRLDVGAWLATYERGAPCERGETAANSGCVPSSRDPRGENAPAPKEAPNPAEGAVNPALEGVSTTDDVKALQQLLGTPVRMAVAAKRKMGEAAGDMTQKLESAGWPPFQAKVIAGAAAASAVLPVTWTAVIATGVAAATGGTVPLAVWAIPGFVEAGAMVGTAVVGRKAAAAVSGVFKRLASKGSAS